MMKRGLLEFCLFFLKIGMQRFSTSLYFLTLPFFKKTLAYFAIQNQDWEFINYLITAGMLDQPINPENETLLHLLVIEALSRQSEDLQEIKIMFVLGRELPGNRSSTRAKAFGCIEQLLEKGASITIANKKGKTVVGTLFEASESITPPADHSSFVKLLTLFFTKRRKDLQGNPILNSKAFREPLLIYLTSRREEALLDLMLEAKADIEVKNFQGETALSEALTGATYCYDKKHHEAYFRILEKLLKAGANPNIRTGYPKNHILIDRLKSNSSDQKAMRRAMQLFIDLREKDLEDLPLIREKLNEL